MLWLATAMLTPQLRRVPIGFGFGHARIIVLLAFIVIALVVAAISRRNGR